jgi:hypothetical protein
MAELEADGTIGALASDTVSILGSITKWDELATITAAHIHDEFTRQGVDLVLVVPLCPQCHQATAVLARAVEARGRPTCCCPRCVISPRRTGPREPCWSIIPSALHAGASATPNTNAPPYERR